MILESQITSNSTSNDTLTSEYLVMATSGVLLTDDYELWHRVSSFAKDGIFHEDDIKPTYVEVITRYDFIIQDIWREIILQLGIDSHLNDSYKALNRWSDAHREASPQRGREPLHIALQSYGGEKKHYESLATLIGYLDAFNFVHDATFTFFTPHLDNLPWNRWSNL